MCGNQRNYLFEGVSCFDVLRNVLNRALAEAKSYQEDTILGRSTDDLVAELVAKYTLQFPTLQVENVWVDDQEVKQAISSRAYSIFDDTRAGTTRTETHHVVTFHVPFEGDGNLYNCGPSTRSVPGPVGKVEGQEIVFDIVSNKLTPEQLKVNFEGNAASIQKHMATLRQDLMHVTSQFEEPVRQYFEQRRRELLRGKDMVASLGFPMKKRSDAPTTYRAPEVRRKVAAARPATAKPFKPEPSLDEADYQHVLNIMDNMTKVMERSPHTFHKMGEEDIRQHFLVQLNGQYEGQATGETFNSQGKTDILIRSEGRNIFIAECKFWRGEKVFLETIDQLLSYLTWRDTKTALVVFNQNKNLTGVLDTIKSVTPNHKQFKRGPQVEGETRFRYVFASPEDSDREIIVTVLVYDVPTVD